MEIIGWLFSFLIREHFIFIGCQLRIGTKVRDCRKFLAYHLCHIKVPVTLIFLFIIQPVYSDQTDFIRDLTLNLELQNEIKLQSNLDYPDLDYLDFLLRSRRVRIIEVGLYTPFLHRDLRYILRVFLEGVLLFAPLLERAFVL